MTDARPAAAALALAGVAERRRTAGAARLRELGPGGLGELAVALGRQRVLPLLGARAIALGEIPPGAFTATVAEATRTAQRLGALQGMVLDRVLERLRSAGIPALALKGVPLAERLHGDAGLRTSSDIDVLVPREQLPAALRALARDGYVPRAEWCDHRGLPMLHRTLIAPGLPPVEIHWRIHWYEERFGADLLRRSVPDERWGRRPDPVDEGLALLLFHARDGLGGLRAPADVGAWWDGAGGATPLGAIAERVGRYPALANSFTAAWDALAPAIGLPGRPWAAPASVRVRLAARLADPDLDASPDQIAAERSLADGLLSPRSGLRRYARRALVVPLDTIRERAEGSGAGAEPNRLRLRAAQAAMPAQVLSRFAVAVARRARPAARG